MKIFKTYALYVLGELLTRPRRGSARIPSPVWGGGQFAHPPPTPTPTRDLGKLTTDFQNANDICYVRAWTNRLLCEISPQGHRWRHRSVRLKSKFWGISGFPESMYSFSRWQVHNLLMNRHDMSIQHSSASFWAFSDLGSGQGHPMPFLWFWSFSLMIHNFRLSYRSELEKWR